MRQAMVFLVVLAIVFPQLAKANYAGKPGRGISTWQAVRGPEDSYWEKLERGDVIFMVTRFNPVDPNAAGFMALEEGGAFFAVRTPPTLDDGKWANEKDADSRWAVVVPQLGYQLLCVFPAEDVGKIKQMQYHDGSSMTDLDGVVGPEGGFKVVDDGVNGILLRRRTPEHAALFAFIRMVREAGRQAAPDHIRGILSKDVDKPVIPRGLQALFDVLRLVSSATIFAANILVKHQAEDRIWRWQPGRIARGGAELSYRYSDFAYRNPRPNPHGTRAEWPLNHREWLTATKLWYAAVKFWESLEQKRKSSGDPGWYLTYCLGKLGANAQATRRPEPRAATSRPQYFYAPREDTPPPQSTSGGHAQAFFAPRHYPLSEVERARGVQAQRDGPEAHNEDDHNRDVIGE